MSRNLFWLSDEQWARIEPHFPKDVRGVERADCRRVISGIVQCSGAAAAGAIARKLMVHRRRSITASYAGLGVASGKTCSGSLPGTDDPQTLR
jgi:transposase